MRNLPANLPMLPGNQYADPTITRYHKAQLMNSAADGAMLGKCFLAHVPHREDDESDRERKPRPLAIHA